MLLFQSKPKSDVSSNSMFISSSLCTSPSFDDTAASHAAVADDAVVRAAQQRVRMLDDMYRSLQRQQADAQAAFQQAQKDRNLQKAGKMLSLRNRLNKRIAYYEGVRAAAVAEADTAVAAAMRHLRRCEEEEEKTPEQEQEGEGVGQGFVATISFDMLET